MNSLYPVVPLIEACTPVERPEVPTPGQSYRQIGVQLWGQGAYERETIDGSQTKYATLSRVEVGDIIVNKIWARNGSVAVVTDTLAGCYGSAEFPTFAPVREKMQPRWFHWITKTRWFWEQCDEKSRGTSGQNRIRPERFLEVKIPLPPLTEQRHTIARIEELAAKIEEARGLRRDSVEQASAVLPRMLHKIFVEQENQWPISKVDSATEIVDPNPSHRMPRYTERDGVPFISTVDFDGPETIRRQTAKYVTKETYEEQVERCRFTEGDILYSRIGTIGQARLLTTVWPFALSHVLVVVKPNTELVAPRFLLWYLRSDAIVSQAFEATRSIGVPDLGIKRIRDFHMPLPPFTEQYHIVAYLDSLQAKVDALKALQAETQAELDALLPSVLDKAFKGEL